MNLAVVVISVACCVVCVVLLCAAPPQTASLFQSHRFIFVELPVDSVLDHQSYGGGLQQQDARCVPGCVFLLDV